MAARPAIGAATKISASLGIVLAMVLGLLGNVLVARHYARWDWTSSGLYTLSDATVETLRTLEEPVTVYVLLGPGDPLAISVGQLLDAYRAVSSRVEVKVTDPDRHPAEFLALQQKYRIVPGRTEDGRVVTDASILVVRGERTFFLTSRDLVEVEDEDDTRARPRLEQALTTAIRGVTSGDAPRVCFTTGHGERTVDDGGPNGLVELRERLTKNNYTAESVEAAREGGKDPLEGCAVVVLAAPTERVPAADVAVMRRHVERGGSLFVVAGPQPDEKEERYLDLGVADLLALASVRARADFVFELDPEKRSSQGLGETFTPDPRPHAITDGLMRAQQRDRGLAVVLTVASSLEATSGSAVAPAALLVTSAEAFGMADFLAWAKNPSEPVAGPKDTRGPLTIAFAAELPKPAGSSAPRGPRVVVLSAGSALFGANWQSQDLRGTALFVESAISWLAARPSNLDIPNKPSFSAGLRLTEDDLASIFRYVVVFMPLAAALFGVAIHLRRRGTERRGAPEQPGSE
jgi:hypothetical protein